jgi:CRP-like cAMP-binding protein
MDELRAKWHAASESNRIAEAVTYLVELERLDPQDPLWPQRLAEAHRRTGQLPEAVLAYERAFHRYLERGFLPRAIAMAKLVGSLDSARGDLLEAHLPRDPAPALKSVRNVAGIPAPAEPAPFEIERDPSLVVPSKAVRPTPLTRAEDGASDEVRFADAAESSMSFSIVEVKGPGAFGAMVISDDDDDDAPPTRPLGPDEAREEPGPDAYATMATVRLFASLSREALLALSNAAEVVEFIPGAMIIVRDERAFALYAIVSGVAAVTVTGSEKPIRLKEGDIFGEAVLLDEGKRQANVKAETGLMTLRIDKQALDAVTKEYPEVEDALFALLARRLVTNLMQTSPLFAPFEPKDRLELAQSFEVRRALAGTVLAHKGRRSDGLYVLLAGTVMAEPEGQATLRIARGTVFGQASLLGAGMADVTIRAVTEAVVLRLPAPGFTAVAAQYPPVLAYIADTVSDPLPESERG